MLKLQLMRHKNKQMSFIWKSEKWTGKSGEWQIIYIAH